MLWAKASAADISIQPLKTLLPIKNRAVAQSSQLTRRHQITLWNLLPSAI